MRVRLWLATARPAGRATQGQEIKQALPDWLRELSSGLADNANPSSLFIYLLSFSYRLFFYILPTLRVHETRPADTNVTEALPLSQLRPHSPLN